MRVLFKKASENPVLGRQLGTCFDASILFERDCYRMWFSWRDKMAIALVDSCDGVAWSKQAKVIIADSRPLWKKLLRVKRKNISRPCVIFHEGKYHIWYCVHSTTISINYAVSDDGISWKRFGKPVLWPELLWEKDALMGPCVIYDEQEKMFKMWYSGGGQYEPDAIGYATSPDGLTWRKHSSNPIFTADPTVPWEKDRTVGLHVMKKDGYYLGFYIGFASGFEKSCIGLARSKDGVLNWERYKGNPIITPGPAGGWDDCNVYRPYVINQGDKWLLWYNASRFSDRVEQIGLAICDRLDFE